MPRRRKAQREIDQRICDERDRFQICGVKLSLVYYDPLDVDAALHEVVSVRVYD